MNIPLYYLCIFGIRIWDNIEDRNAHGFQIHNTLLQIILESKNIIMKVLKYAVHFTFQFYIHHTSTGIVI